MPATGNMEHNLVFFVDIKNSSNRLFKNPLSPLRYVWEPVYGLSARSSPNTFNYISHFLSTFIMYHVRKTLGSKNYRKKVEKLSLFELFIRVKSQRFIKIKFKSTAFFFFFF